MKFHRRLERSPFPTLDRRGAPEVSEHSEPMPSDHGAAHERLKGADKLLSSRVDSLKELHSDHRRECDERFESIEGRVTKVERWQWFCYGIAAAIGAVATWVLKGLGLRE